MVLLQLLWSVNSGASAAPVRPPRLSFFRRTALSVATTNSNPDWTGPRQRANLARKQPLRVRMTVRPPTSPHVEVVSARVARKAPQRGLSFLKRPLENAPGIPGQANSLDFLRAHDGRVVVCDARRSNVRRYPREATLSGNRRATSGSYLDRFIHHHQFES